MVTFVFLGVEIILLAFAILSLFLSQKKRRTKGSCEDQRGQKGQLQRTHSRATVTHGRAVIPEGTHGWTHGHAVIPEGTHDWTHQNAAFEERGVRDRAKATTGNPWWWTHGRAAWDARPCTPSAPGLFRFPSCPFVFSRDLLVFPTILPLR